MALHLGTSGGPKGGGGSCERGTPVQHEGVATPKLRNDTAIPHEAERKLIGDPMRFQAVGHGNTAETPATVN